LLEAHGGTIKLLASDAGTHFRLGLPISVNNAAINH
jgi:hypothetical protein